MYQQGSVHGYHNIVTELEIPLCGQLFRMEDNIIESCLWLLPIGQSHADIYILYMFTVLHHYIQLNHGYNNYMVVCWYYTQM